MTVVRPSFHEGIHWRRLTSAERDGRPWKYVLLRDVAFHFGEAIYPGAFHPDIYHLMDADGTERGTIATNVIIVREGYAWNGCSASPDWELLASLPHDLLYQFSACKGFPPTVTRKFADDMFYALRTTAMGWAYRAGLWLGSWSAWRRSNFGCTVRKETL